jgi:hypothetical protein
VSNICMNTPVATSQSIGRNEAPVRCNIGTVYRA